MKIMNLRYNPITQINNKQQNTPAFKGKIIVVEEGRVPFYKIMIDLMLSLKSTAEKTWTSLTSNCRELTFDSSLDIKAKLMTDLLNAKHAKDDFKLVFIEEEKLIAERNLIQKAAELN